MEKDKDKIVSYDSTTNFYINGRGEALKFTKGSTSIYSTTPNKPHDGTHIKYKAETKKITVTTHKNGERTTSQTGNCYLTTACIRYYQENFNDTCEELTILRWFRDNFVDKEDIELYYIVAPEIVEKVNSLPENEKFKIYSYIYDKIIKYCVHAIKNGEYDKAYQRYKASVLTLAEEYYKNNTNYSKKLKNI